MASRYGLPVHGITSDGACVTIAEIELGHLVQLAGWDRFNEAAGQALLAHSLALPADYQRPVRGEQATVWCIAPERVLVRSPQALPIESSDDLVALDLSDARTCLTVEGPGAAGLLARVIAMDLSPLAFPVGSFAQTAPHHVGVLVERNAEDQFSLFIPTTWTTSLIDFLTTHITRDPSMEGPQK